MVHLKIVLALLACVVIASSSEQVEIDNYIVGGQTARPNQFPFMVSLRTMQNFHFCGAGILSDRWLVSAAHCTQKETSDPRNVAAVFGAHHRANDGHPVRVDTIINHPGYNEQWMLNDICVLRTAQSVPTVQGRIHPLRLPTRDYTEGQNQRVWIAGWGKTNYPGVNNNNVHPFLQFKEARTIALGECRQRLAPINLHFMVHGNKLCTMTNDGLGTCMGDSGGPLVDDNGCIVGVVSWGIPCGTPHPDVYSRIFPHLNFIVASTGVRPQ